MANDEMRQKVRSHGVAQKCVRTECVYGVSDPPTRVDYPQVESIEVSVASASSLRILFRPYNQIVLLAVLLHPFAALPEAEG